MVKKVSIVVQSRLRRMIEREGMKHFVAKGSFLDTFHLMDRVVGACLVGGFKSSEACPKPLQKYLGAGYAEFDWLEQAFRRSSRLQLVLGLGHEAMMDFKVELYEKGNKEPIYTLDGSVGLEDGAMHSVGSTHIPIAA